MLLRSFRRINRSPFEATSVSSGASGIDLGDHIVPVSLHFGASWGIVGSAAGRS
jgi:hypothetical protein